MARRLIDRMIALHNALFGRSRKPARDRDTDDWAPGDLAEALGRGPWMNGRLMPTDGPQPGDVYRVISVRLSPHPFTGAPVLWLTFASFGIQMFTASSFRKVIPRADAAEAADASFLEQIRPADTVAPAPPLPIAARLKRILP